MELAQNNIMVDLETMGKSSNAAIVSVGAVAFNSEGVTSEFYLNIDLEDSMRYGVVDASTVLWWLQQEDAAKKALLEDPKRLDKVLYEFSRFIKDQSVPVDAIWGNGCTFDNVILANAYKAVRRDTPWRYWMDRCFRTARAILPQVGWTPVEGCAHNALSDAKSQALYLIDAIRQEGMT